MDHSVPIPTATPAPGLASGPPRGRRRRWLILAGALALVVLLLAAGDIREWMRGALSLVERLGVWGPIVFIAVYAVATVFFVPGSVLTLGAGALFGVGWGSVYVSAGSTLGATFAFLVGRYVAREWVAAKIQGNERFSAIDRAVAEEGWRIVGLTRLSPVFPFTLLNYAFGLTQISLRGYVLASWIGMMPGTVMYVYLGSLARVGADAARRSPAEWALYAAGLVATAAVTIVITRIARRALTRRA